jgi:hypothetical protein
MTLPAYPSEWRAGTGFSRRGVTERVAMRISGHKSNTVLDRYNIVSESDLADAALKVEQGAKAELTRASEIHSSYIA